MGGPCRRRAARQTCPPQPSVQYHATLKKETEPLTEKAAKVRAAECDPKRDALLCLIADSEATHDDAYDPHRTIEDLPLLLTRVRRRLGL